MLMAHLIWVAWVIKKYQAGTTCSETETKKSRHSKVAGFFLAGICD